MNASGIRALAKGVAKLGKALKVGVIGAGWPGAAHAKGYQAAGGYELYAVADLIAQRREQFAAQFAAQRQYANADELLEDKFIDVVSICLPNDLHAPTAIVALKAGKHVVCETPPALSMSELRKMANAAAKAGRVLLFAMQRRFGGCEQAARQAVARKLLGEVYHVRAAWMRTRAVPSGTGWYTIRQRAGGGAFSDLGLHMLDLAWDLLGSPAPVAVMAVGHNAINPSTAGKFDVEEAGSTLLHFAGGGAIDLSASWAMNQPPQQSGAVCRVCGTQGALEVYTAQGAVLYRDFDAQGKCRPIALKGPKMLHHGALMRHLKECIVGKAQPLAGSERAMALMEMLHAIYKSIDSRKSVNLEKAAPEDPSTAEPGKP